MKYSLYVLLLTVVCLSCKTKAKHDGKDSLAVVNPLSEAQQLIAKFKPIIQGVWVKSDYIEKVARTKSPLAASNEAQDLTTMYINTGNIKGDSLMVLSGWGNHDGSEVKLKFKQGKIPGSIIWGGDDLVISLADGDTSLIWHRVDKGVVKRIKYVRALYRQADDLGYGMDYLINKNLVSGIYILSDTAGASLRIKFGDHGTVSGFSNFKKFRINIDFDSGPESNLDEIFFLNAEDKNLKSYSFKITADTLRLYETSHNADSTELILGKLKYQLVRKR